MYWPIPRSPAVALPGLRQAGKTTIDKGRRAGRGAGQYLLLGSASLDLVKQPVRKYVVRPGVECYRLAADIEGISLIAPASALNADG